MKSLPWLVAAGYTAAVAGWIFTVLDTSRADALASNDVAPLVWALVHVVVGFAIGRWSAPLLAGVPLLLSLPAGAAETYSETPLWLSFLFVTPVLALLLAIGVALRKLPPVLPRRRPQDGGAVTAADAPSGPGRVELAAALLYSALVTAWAYGVLNAGVTDSSAPDPFWDGPIPWILFACLNLLLGFAVGRWWCSPSSSRRLSRSRLGTNRTDIPRCRSRSTSRFGSVSSSVRGVRLRCAEALRAEPLERPPQIVLNCSNGWRQLAQ